MWPLHYCKIYDRSHPKIQFLNQSKEDFLTFTMACFYVVKITLTYLRINKTYDVVKFVLFLTYGSHGFVFEVSNSLKFPLSKSVQASGYHKTSIEYQSQNTALLLANIRNVFLTNQSEASCSKIVRLQQYKFWIEIIATRMEMFDWRVFYGIFPNLYIHVYCLFGCESPSCKHILPFA